MTPAEAKKAQGSLSLEGMTWMPREDLESLRTAEKPGRDAFVRVDGKWTYKYQKDVEGRLYYSYEGRYLPREEVRARRLDWAHAWVFETDDFVVRSNVDEDLLFTIVELLEAAWPEYCRLTRARPDRPLEYFAFRTFEDYRAYCQENDFLDAIRGAQGFYDPKNNRGVAYLGEDAEYFVTTSIHELGHLFYANCHRHAYPESWFAEGFATYLEGIAREGDHFRFHGIPADSAKIMALLVEGKNVPEIWNLIRHSSMGSIAGGFGHSFYACSWALFDYLEENADGDPALAKMWEFYRQNVAAGKYVKGAGEVPPRGQDPLELAMADTGVDVNVLQRKWEAWLARKARGWAKLSEGRLLPDARGEAGAAPPSDDDGRIAFRGRRMTVDEIRSLLATENPAADEDPRDDLVRTKTKENTHWLDEGRLGISLPKSPGWIVEPLADAAIRIGQPRFQIRRERAGKALVTIDCIAVDTRDAWRWKNRVIEGSDGRALVDLLLEQKMEMKKGEDATDLGKFDQTRFTRRLVRYSDDERLLMVATLKNEGGACHLLLVEFAPGAYEEFAKPVDSILATLQREGEW